MTRCCPHHPHRHDDNGCGLCGCTATHRYIPTPSMHDLVIGLTLWGACLLLVLKGCP